jgi:hypothetical protein
VFVRELRVALEETARELRGVRFRDALLGKSASGKPQSKVEQKIIPFYPLRKCWSYRCGTTRDRQELRMVVTGKGRKYVLRAGHDDELTGAEGVMA